MTTQDLDFGECAPSAQGGLRRRAYDDTAFPAAHRCVKKSAKMPCAFRWHARFGCADGLTGKKSLPFHRPFAKIGVSDGFAWAHGSKNEALPCLEFREKRIKSVSDKQVVPKELKSVVDFSDISPG